MSAKRAAIAMLQLDPNLADFARALEPGGYDPDKKSKVVTYIRENVMNTWTLTLAAQAAGSTEQQVIGALLELEPLRWGTQGHGRAMAASLYKA